MAKTPPIQRPLARRVVDLAFRCAERRPLNDGPLPGVVGLRFPGEAEPYLVCGFSASDGPLAIAISGPGARVADLRARVFDAPGPESASDAAEKPGMPPVAADFAFAMIEPTRQVPEPLREVFRISGRSGRSTAYFVGCAAGQSVFQPLSKARLRRIGDILDAVLGIAEERTVPTVELTGQGAIRVPTIAIDEAGRPAAPITEVFVAEGCLGPFDRGAALAALPVAGDAVHVGVRDVEIAPQLEMAAIAMVLPDSGDLAELRFAAAGDTEAIADAVTDCLLDGADARPAGIPARLTVEDEALAEALRRRCGAIVDIAVVGRSDDVDRFVEQFRRRLAGMPADDESTYRWAAETLVQRALDLEGEDGAFGFRGRREFFGVGQMPDHPMAAPAQLEWVLMHRRSADGRRLVDRMLDEAQEPPLDEDVRVLLAARLDAAPTIWEVRDVVDGALALVDRCAEGVTAVVPFRDAVAAAHVPIGSWLIGSVVMALGETQFLALGPLIGPDHVLEVAALLEADGFDWTHAAVAARPERFGRLFVPLRNP